MNSPKPANSLHAILAFVALAMFHSSPVVAQTFTTLADFNVKNGQYPYFMSLSQATNGSLYGTTNGGGASFDGTVFSVTNGKFAVVRSFCSAAGCTDGKNPWAGVIQATNGFLYGTTYSGGANNGGSVFQLGWGGELATLYSFCAYGNCSDGEGPSAGLIQTRSGNLYGTTYTGGINSGGTVFSISPVGTLKTVYNFCSQAVCADGSTPVEGVVEGSNGNLYGTTLYWGVHNAGTVYSISPAGKFKSIHSFCSLTTCRDGSEPYGGLVAGADGNLYGTTAAGGLNGYGTIFRITPGGVLTTLYDFNSTDGSPSSALVQANDGDFYGTSWASAPPVNGGMIFKISPSGDYQALYNFCISSTDCTGAFPFGGLVQGTDGKLYGTTNDGGLYGAGLIYSLDVGLQSFVKTLPVTATVGVRVSVLGNSLSGATSVTFNGVTASFRVVSDTQIVATVPAGATSGTVQVTTPSRTLNSYPPFRILH